MDIKDKLRKLDPANNKEKLNKNDKIKNDKSKVSVPSSQNLSSNKNKIISCLGGKIKKNEKGKFFSCKKEYKFDYCHGSYPLAKIKECNKINLKYIFNIDLKNPLGYKDFLFIDTETTGLAGGTGTVPFMVGIGYFSGKQFIVEQFFLRDFDEEGALLQELKRILSEYPALVSFNGKSFDLPLINTRLVLHRYNRLKTNRHFDLLHAARRIWSHLDSCSLDHLENKKLNITRHNYLPGSEVPAIYFDYLQNKKPDILKPVFRHNLIDIISLVTLLNHLNSIFSGEIESELSSRELFNLGKVYEKDKQYKICINYLKKARQKVGSKYLLTEIEKKLSWQYKRRESWDKAVQIWKTMIHDNRGRLFPYIELAKFYEHQAKKYLKAKRYTKKALVNLKEKRRITTDYQNKKQELEYRLNRLNDKI